MVEEEEKDEARDTLHGQKDGKEKTRRIGQKKGKSRARNASKFLTCNNYDRLGSCFIKENNTAV